MAGAVRRLGRLSRRAAAQRLLALGALSAGACALAQPTTAPVAAFKGPLKIVVPFGAGGVADFTARTVAQALAERVGQPITIDNRPGAGGVGAADAVLRAEPDGHTLLLMSNATAVSVGLFKQLPYDPVRDFSPVGLLGTFDLALVVAEGSRFNTAADWLAAARAQPGRLNLGSINIGSTQHLSAELLKASANIDVQVVPFNGTPAVLQALRGGQIDAAIEVVSPLLGQLQARALRALAVLGSQRVGRGSAVPGLAALVDVPTLAEVGVAALQVSSWNALAAPARTPPATLVRLQRELAAVLQTPDVRQRLEGQGVAARVGTEAGMGEQLAQLLATDIARWRGVIQRAAVPLQ